ncbi:FprA family A-type flavoprotein [Deferribacterales bacterium Es71-Z0220]|uniref:FprA family A-type flavoprotein n=1 Tax=Deferrivibrio essentukiensis TaxID=2880922 RepID=UPI001F60111F|nr:FprA family A-type flavoprotein [Deferrivibrio essentukiensis]MCB4204340.1 FprA family A-type flavoprotein [Deferrivibrio essentukiensis]
MKAIQIKENIFWVGVRDPKLEVFDIVIPTKHGTTYNSYLVIGSEKKALIEANKMIFADEYVKTIEEICPIKDIDYIILNHNEPDHSGALPKILEINPNIEVIYSKTGKNFVQNIVNKEFNGRAVGDADTIDLGGKTLRFFHTPFLHWPDTMFTYLVEDEILFPCDFLGAHYCPETGIFNDEIKEKKDTQEAFKFYYNAIMRPYKEHILTAFKKIENITIKMVCPSHGPILRENIDFYINFYKEQANRYYQNNHNRQITVVYATAYGNTKLLAEQIKKGAEETGIIVKMFDAAETNASTIIDEIEISHGLLMGTATINAKAPKPIFNIFAQLVVLNVSNRKAGAFGSYGWSGEGVKMCEDILKTMRMKLPLESLKVQMTPSEEELKKAYDWGREFALKVLEGN